jgi:glycerol-3-phosphate dehydrogenase (NAD(P)+)
MLARSQAESNQLTDANENSRFLPGVSFPSGLRVSSDISQVITSSDLIIIAVPSNSFRSNVSLIKPFLSKGIPVLSATKGLEIGSNKRMSEILLDELHDELHECVCVLSGPNLAKEIIAGSPASAVVASEYPDSAEAAQDILTSATFRAYVSRDVVGVELAGALKNVIALGAGFCDGLAIGDNAKGAFITRGLAEMSRLGVALGAQPVTFAGLAGIGDIIATCSSSLSRNHYVGEQLAMGRTLAQISAHMDNVAEGVNTTKAAYALSKYMNVEMPIVSVTYNVLFEGLLPKDAVSRLMERPVGFEQ